MADELDQQYMRTRQAMRKWQGQIFEEVDTGDPIVVPQEGGPTQVYMGTVRRMKPQEGTGTDPNAPKAEAPPTITPAPVKPGPYEEAIQRESAKNNLDPDLLRAVMQEESGGRPDVVSPKGATGLMQLMPETAAEAGVTDALDPYQNIAGGAKVLGQLMTKFEGDKVKALAAYNFGRGNVAKGKPYPKETKSYIEKILSHLPTDVSAEAGESPVGDEAVGITPRREFTVDTPEMQQQKQRIRGEFEERIAPWKFDLSTFDVPGDVLRAGLAKLSGVDRGEKEGTLRMSSDEMVERVFFKYGDKPEEVIKQAEKLGLPEAQTLKIMAGLSAIVLGAVMDPLNVAGPGGKGKEAGKAAEGMVRLYRGESKIKDAKLPEWLKDSPEQQQRQAVEGRWFTDKKDIAEWYQKDAGQEGVISYIDVPKAEAEKYRVTNNEEAKKFSLDPEREFLMPRETADKRTILSEFQRAAKIIKEERGSVPLGGADEAIAASDAAREALQQAKLKWVDINEAAKEARTAVKQATTAETKKTAEAALKIAASELRASNTEVRMLTEKVEEARNAARVALGAKPVEPFTPSSQKISASDILKSERGSVPLGPDGGTAENYKKWFEQVAIKAQQEGKGQDVLDQLDEIGKTPKQVIQEFWAQTYPQLPDEVKERFHKTIKKLTGMKPGDVVAIGPNKEEVRAADWAQALGEDFGPHAEDLEGTERGMIALMEMANQRRVAVGAKPGIAGLGETIDIPPGGKPPEIPPARIGGPVEEPLSGKQLALLSKREESRQNYGFKVEGFEEELTKQRRGPVLSDEAVQKLAAESGFTLEDLMYLKPGSVLAPEIQLAAREVYRAAADRMTSSAKTYLAMPTPENMNDFAEAFTQAGLATTRIIGTFAESGRTMRLLNQKVPGMAKAGEAQAHDPQFRIQDAYIKQMYEFFRQAEAKSKMGGFAGPAGQAAQPGVVTPGQLAQMVVELPSEEAVMNFAKAAIKPTWSDMMYEVWINGLLSGPVTHATNIISNAATIAWNIPERAVASMLHPQTVRPGEAAAMMGGVMESVGDAWRLAWKAFKEDAPQFGQSKLDMPTRAITADAFDFTGNVGRAVDYLGITARLPGRFLMAADDFFKAIAFRAELRALAKRESFKQVNELGLTGKEASKTIKEIEHRILADPPEHIKEAAQDFAAYTTFTRELGETGQAIQHAIYATPMGRVVVPFIRTPANIFKFAGERTPLALFSRAVKDELAAGGERAALAQAKIALGSMTMGFMGMLAANGHITGGGPKDKALRKQWEDGGWQAYSFKIGNEYISYARIEPLGSLIGMAADATEIMGQLNEKDAGELAAALTVAISRNVANKTFVKGLAGTLNAVTSQDVNVVKGFLEKELPTILPYSSALGQTAKVVDPVQREVRSILDAFKAKVPGWSESLQAELNLWGETKPQRTAVGPDFISPIYSSVYKDDPVINEMNRLEKAFTIPSKNIGGLRYGSADLPDATYWRYVELSAGKDNLIKGMNLHDKIHKTITAPMYGMATKEGQIAYIQSDIDLFRQAAMLRLRKENPEFDKAMLRQEFKEKTKKSAATQERVLAAPRLQ